MLLGIEMSNLKTQESSNHKIRKSVSDNKEMRKTFDCDRVRVEEDTSGQVRAKYVKVKANSDVEMHNNNDKLDKDHHKGRRKNIIERHTRKEPQSGEERRIKQESRGGERRIKDQRRGGERRIKEEPRGDEKHIKQDPRGGEERRIKEKPRGVDRRIKDQPRSGERRITEAPRGAERHIKLHPRDNEERRIKEEPRDCDERRIKEEPRGGESHIKQEPLVGEERPIIKHEPRHGDEEDGEQRRRTNHHRKRAHGRWQEDADAQYKFGKAEHSTDDSEGAPPRDKAKPDFKISGKLAEDTNTYKGVVIKYNEPDEARKPRTRWRLYPFKGDTALPLLPVHRQSAYLIGRDRLVADIPVDHPSCSKQHAVLQYRLVSYSREDGLVGRRVRPYVIDLDSANGTFVNNKRIDARRYVELLEKDMIKFGFSSREYVILHENSKDDLADDTGID